MSDDAITTVLIVEDEQMLQDVYKMILISQGYRVLTANNGYEALLEIKKVVPDVILLDYFMPRMDGKNFLQNFDQSTYPDIKIVMASNISDPAAIQEMMQLGAQRHVLKSDLSPAQLIDLVEKTVAG